MAEQALIIILAVLSTARLTRLFTGDRITEAFRLRAETWGLKGYLFTCDWCLSMWLAFPIAVSAYLWGDTGGWLVVAGALSASYVTGWLAALEPG